MIIRTIKFIAIILIFLKYYNSRTTAQYNTFMSYYQFQLSSDKKNNENLQIKTYFNNHFNFFYRRNYKC